MPSKGSKRASRQVKLRQQKRRNRGSTQTFDAGPIKSSRTRPEIHTTEDEKESSMLSAATPKRQQPHLPAAPVLSSIYLGSELKRIGATSIVIIALLAVSSFFLAG